MPLPQNLIDKASDIVLEWAQEATDKMKENLRTRLKRNSQESLLGQSIIFDGTKIDSDGITLSWNMEDYYMFVDLGVKGVKNTAKTYGNFSFKNLHVSRKFIKSMELYITRKGIPVRQADDSKSMESKKGIMDRRKAMAFQMAVSVKKKGITGTKFYTDVFNEKELQALADRLSDLMGEDLEVRIIQNIKA